MLLEAGVPALCGAALRLAPRFGVDAVLCRTTVRSPIYYLTLFIGIIVFILARTIISWRSRKSSGYYGSGMAGRVGKGRDALPTVGLEGLTPGLPLTSAIGAVCPRCGTIAGQGAITCPSCGYDGPGFTEPATRTPTPSQAPAAVPPQPAAVGFEVGASAKCPYCGTLFAAGTTICPVCNWRLRATAAAATTTPAAGRIGIVRRDVMAGGAVAFLKDEWVKVELESPDPQRPEYKYVCHSQSLDKKFRLSDMDLSL